jgi:hypothetical protein
MSPSGQMRVWLALVPVAQSGQLETSAADPHRALVRATASLPIPRTTQERVTAIEADAQAAAEGAFAEYSIVRAPPVDDSDDDDDVTPGWTQVYDV